MNLAQYLKDGWKITGDGPTGVQLERKTMKLLDKICLGVGAVLLLAGGIGIILILIALIDYFVLTKPETKFISRSSTLATR